MESALPGENDYISIGRLNVTEADFSDITGETGETGETAERGALILEVLNRSFQLGILAFQ